MGGQVQRRTQAMVAQHIGQAAGHDARSHTVPALQRAALLADCVGLQVQAVGIQPMHLGQNVTCVGSHASGAMENKMN